jgi:hypothetical protein
MGHLQLSTIGPLHRAELVGIHLVAVLDSPPYMVITTSLVEEGYEAGFWRSQVGHQKVTRGWLGGTLSSSAWRRSVINSPSTPSPQTIGGYAQELCPPAR